MNIMFRKANSDDHEALEHLRAEAFRPVFASFKRILGEEIYELAQRREDEEQVNLLAAMFSVKSEWRLYVAEVEDELVGFVSFKTNPETTVGEIGLNAVKPAFAGKGIGTAMYDFAHAEMKAAGVRVSTVATGGDASHAPARRAYEKAGFDVQIPSVWYCRLL